MLKVERIVFFQACRRIKAKTPFASVFYDISKSKIHSRRKRLAKISESTRVPFQHRHIQGWLQIEVPAHLEVDNDTR